MVELVLHRKYKLKDYTIGKLFENRDDKEIYICDVLEDTVRNKAAAMARNFIKIHGKTAIPYGRYRIIRTFSGRFRRILPELLDVPCYVGIRIHPGNTANDTEGCLLPGLNTVKGKVTNSRHWFSVVDGIIVDGLKKGDVYITITD